MKRLNNMAEKKITSKKEVAEKTKVKKTSVSAVKPVKKTDALTANVYDISGKVVDTLELPKELFGVKVNKRLIAQAVRVFLANQRAGSASTKTRGEVQGSTRKIYRQKGTGRARHGGVRAPIFVHGGIAHGPKPKDFSLQMPQSMKKAALLSMLSAKAQSGEISILTGVEKIEPKTKQMAALLKHMNGDKKQGSVLFVLDLKHDSVIRSVRNIEGVTYEYAKQLHTYELIQNKKVIFMLSAIEEMKKNLLAKKTVKK